MERTTMASWIIKALEDSGNGRKLPYELKDYIKENAQKAGLCVCVEDCIFEKADFENLGTSQSDFIFFQSNQMYASHESINKFKDALILHNINPENTYYKYNYAVSWYIPPKLKTRTIYAVQVICDLDGNKKICSYSETYDIAMREAQLYSHCFSDLPVGNEGIVPIEVIIE